MSFYIFEVFIIPMEYPSILSLYRTVEHPHCIDLGNCNPPVAPALQEELLSTDKIANTLRSW